MVASLKEGLDKLQGDSSDVPMIILYGRSLLFNVTVIIAPPSLLIVIELNFKKIISP